ncbi:MAG: putative zinc-binding metallopeptidase [Hyphomonadaceae bacterium]
MTKRRASRRALRRRPLDAPWAALRDDELLALRLKDLRLSIQGSWLEHCVAKLNDELAAKGLAVRAHAWISDEWFSPDNTPGISIPFYLAHPRLVRLEQTMMGHAEGGAERECMRIMRHEAGHVVQHAYALQRRRRWQMLFGRSSAPYPDYYRPNPTSKDYVRHLDRWYAQCHPDEDFAETFAVWLTPRSAWRKRYADWPHALEKLEYVDALMAEIAGQKPLLTKRIQLDPVSKQTMTLAEHYAAKLKRYATDPPSHFDRALKQIFAGAAAKKNAPLAASFIRRHRGEIIEMAMKRPRADQIAVETMLDDICARCAGLKLRAARSGRQMRLDLARLLTNKAARSLYRPSRRLWFAV